MDFGFQARGGTAPSLNNVGYSRSVLSARRKAGVSSTPKPDRPAEYNVEHGALAKERELARRKGWRRSVGLGGGKCAGGSILSTRPASRQALMDLMDLNLALKYDKLEGSEGTGGGGMHPCLHCDTLSSPGQAGPSSNDNSAAARASPKFRFAVSRDKYAVSQDSCSPSSLDLTEHELFDETSTSDLASPTAAPPATPADQPQPIAQEDKRMIRYGYQARTSGKGSPVPIGRAGPGNIGDIESPCMMSQSETRLGASFPPPGRVSPVDVLAEQMVTLPSAPSSCVKSSGRAPGGKPRAVTGSSVGGGGSGRAVNGDSHSICEKAVSHKQQELMRKQREKDVRLWTALRTSLLSGTDGKGARIMGEGKGQEQLTVGNGRMEPQPSMGDGEGGLASGGDFHGTEVKMMARMEQIDIKRSALDRSSKLDRVASARVLESSEDSATSSTTEANLKQPRNRSAGDAQRRKRQSKARCVSAGASGLQFSGLRAELLPRNRDAIASSPNGNFEGGSLFHRGTRAKLREQPDGFGGGRDHGQLRWVSNDEGGANLLQRPPSRQKDAFPKHLADVIPQNAFQVELPLATEEASQHIDDTRKNAVEMARPRSRHKPPGQSLFLEVPQPGRLDYTKTSTVEGHRDPDSPGTVTSLSLVDDLGCKEPSCAGDFDRPSDIPVRELAFSFDQRHDDPDRDGFSVLQVQGPCPFRIEVTNSLKDADAPTTACLLDTNPQPSTSIRVGVGKRLSGGPVIAGVGKQRAPINTTPGSPVTLPKKSVRGRDQPPCSSERQLYSLVSPSHNFFIHYESSLDPFHVKCIQSPLQTWGDMTSGICSMFQACCSFQPIPVDRPVGNKVGPVGAGTLGVDFGNGVVNGLMGMRTGQATSGSGTPTGTSLYCGLGCSHTGARGRAVPTPGVGDAGGLISDPGPRCEHANALERVYGLEDHKQLHITTGSPVLGKSDWSLQSCDDDEGLVRKSWNVPLGAQCRWGMLM